MSASVNVSEEIQFRLGAVGKLPIVASHFKEISINFGVPGQEIIRGVRIPLLVPEKSAMDTYGFVYVHEVEIAKDGTLLRNTNDYLVFSLHSTDNCERTFFAGTALLPYSACYSWAGSCGPHVYSIAMVVSSIQE